MTIPQTGGPEWASGQATPWVTVNEQARRVAGLARFAIVVDQDLNSPPGSCADGATYIIGPSPTGLWAGRPGDIAMAVGVDASNGWYFIDVEEGVFAWVQDESALYRVNASSSPSTWTPYNPGGAIALADLSDVTTDGVADGDVLTYDADSPSGYKMLPPAGVSITLATTITQSGTPATTSVGYLGSPQISDSDDYTFVLSDAGKHYYHPASSSPDHTLTIPANASVAFPIGTVLAGVNEDGAGDLTIAITSDTLRWTDQVGSRTVAENGTFSLLKVASTVWRLTGDGIT